LPLKIIASIVFATLFLSAAPAVRAEKFTIQFASSPPIEQLRPHGAPASLILTVTASDGRLAAEGWVAIRLDAPPRGRFFSSDYPMVEGSRLLEMRLPIINGKAQWRQAFPIRGEYRLDADFVNAAGARSGRVFSFHVRENEQKWLVLGAFAFGLFTVGVVAGRIFSAPKDRGRSKIGVCLLLIVLCSAAVGKSARAGEGQRRSFISKLEVGTARVGRPTRIHWWLHPAGVNGKLSAMLTLTITDLETGDVILSLEKIPVAGEFTMNYQFTDGSEHRVTAVAETDEGDLLREEQMVSVTALAPPLRAKLPALLLFVGMIGAGLAVGRWSWMIRMRTRTRVTHNLNP
jgi:hypothetical protein